MKELTKRSEHLKKLSEIIDFLQKNKSRINTLAVCMSVVNKDGDEIYSFRYEGSMMEAIGLMEYYAHARKNAPTDVEPRDFEDRMD